MPKVSKKGAGAELGRHLDAALRCFEILAERSRFPVSAKIRIVSAEDPKPTLELARGLAALGARAITVHGRIKEAVYSGPVDFGQIRLVREALPDVQVIANGGVTGLEKYREIRRETGCAAVMVARGAMGNPWLFRELTEGGNFSGPTLEEWAGVVRSHVYGMIELYGEESAMRISRKISSTFRFSSHWANDKPNVFLKRRLNVAGERFANLARASNSFTSRKFANTSSLKSMSSDKTG